MSNHPKRGLAVTDFRPNPEVSYRLRYTYSARNCVPAPESPPHTNVPNRTPPALLSAAAPPSCPGRGFQRGGPQPAPLCRFKGVRGEIEIPPRFSLGGRGHSLLKREYPPGFSVPNRYSSAGNPGNLFGKTKRKWGFNPVRHRRTSSHQSGAFDISKEK